MIMKDIYKVLIICKKNFALIPEIKQHMYFSLYLNPFTEFTDMCYTYVAQPLLNYNITYAQQTVF